ncbi:MAG TPA: YfhO family protein [Thermoanaerobaculia bacterium]
MRGSGSRGERAGAAGIVVVTLLLSLFFLDVLLGSGTFYVRDLVYAAHPTKSMLREAILSGEFPHWNRWIGGGQPLAANPAYQLFYPPAWLVLLPDFTYGFNLFVLLHLYIAAWGMYALLRSMDAGPPASAAAALSFALGAVVAVHDFLPVLATLAWLPWTCLYARRFLRDGARRDFALAALFLGVQVLLGEATIVLQTGLILGFYALGAPASPPAAGAASRAATPGGGTPPGQPPGRRRSALLRVALLCVIALLLAAVQILPTIDHARDSVRARGFAFERVVSWSMPAARVAELINPNVLGHQLLNGRAVYWGSPLYGERGLPFVRSIYPGILIAALAMAGLVAGTRGRRVTVILIALSLLLALGMHTPLWRILYDSGLARSIRYPEKFILMGLFALVVFGAMTLDRILAGDEKTIRAARRTTAALAILLGAIALFAMTSLYAPLFIELWNPSQRMFAEMLPASRSGWLLAAGRAALLWILLRNLERVRRPLWIGLAGALVVLDLGLVVPEVAPRMPSEYFEKEPAVATEFKARHRDCRLLHVAALQPPGVYGAQQQDLYWIYRNAMYPLMPGSHGIATVLEPDLDRTALLPAADFSDAVWTQARNDPQWLQRVAPMANVCAVALYTQPPDLQRPVTLMHLPPSPRYVVEERRSRLSGQAGLPVVHRVRETPNTARIEVESAGNATLYMSVTPHKYWQVTIDGKQVRPQVANIAFQSVPVPAGKHVVEMRYRNPLFLTGGILSLLTLSALLWRMR